MLKLLTCDTPQEITALLSREEEVPANVEQAVAEVITAVRKQGDAALLAYTNRFDGVELSALEVTQEEVQWALQQVDPSFLSILQQAKENVAAFHQKQKRQGFIMDEYPGVVLGQKITPLDRVGVYVPGGTASYPSTVLMDTVPAKIAGVGEIIMVTPPDKDGGVSPNILAAAYVAGVDRIFKIGGAQAVAALSYGTQSVPKVDKIVGPGNIYVATAKRMVYGLVDIDMIAGPSEILVVADETADPACVAADLLSQAEHDSLSAAWLITTSNTLASAVQKEVERQVALLPRKEIAAHAISKNSAIILTDSLETAVEISNRIAPEHLELCMDDPFALLPLVKHAGSIFLGKYAPEALGDYFAGPNHTLPTSGTARFSSPLSVDDFCKKSSFIYYDKAALGKAAESIATFARTEGLEGHARSVLSRFQTL